MRAARPLGLRLESKRLATAVTKRAPAEADASWLFSLLNRYSDLSNLISYPCEFRNNLVYGRVDHMWFHVGGSLL